MDAFTFTGTAGRRVIASVVKTSGTLDTDITLVAPSGAEEAYTYSGDQVSRVLLESGTYTIVVSDWGLSATGTYSLALFDAGGGDGGAGGGGGDNGGDTEPPTLSVVVSPPFWTNGPKVDITITAADNSGNVTLTHSGSATPLSGASPQTAVVSVTAEGATTVTFSATDGTGLTASGSAVAQIDRTAPSVPGAPVASTPSTTSVALSWARATDVASGVASYDVYDGATRLANVAVTTYTRSSPSTGRATGAHGGATRGHDACDREPLDQGRYHQEDRADRLRPSCRCRCAPGGCERYAATWPGPHR